MTHNRNKTKTRHRAALSRRTFSLTERNEMTVHNFESARARNQAEIARRAFPLQGPRLVANVFALWPELWAASWAILRGVQAGVVKAWWQK